MKWLKYYFVTTLHKLGWHPWKYYVLPIGMSMGYTHNMDITALRMCKLCGKLMYERPHCLGMNPEKWITEWFDVTPQNEVFVKKIVEVTFETAKRGENYEIYR